MRPGVHHPSRSRCAVAAYAIVCVVVVASCGGSVVDNSEQKPTAASPPVGANDAELGCGTHNNNTCPKGEYCHGPPTCGAKWSCQNRLPPCSAAAGRQACSCEGKVLGVAAGCAQRHAYGIADAFGQHVQIDSGESCDPNRRAPFSVRVQIAGSGFDAAVFDGGRFRVRSRGATPRWFPAEGLPIAQGRFAYTSEEFTRTSDDDFYIEMLADRTGNGTCEVTEDLAWNGTASSADAVSFTVRFDITPPKPDQTHASYCERWR